MLPETTRIAGLLDPCATSTARPDLRISCMACRLLMSPPGTAKEDVMKNSLRDLGARLGVGGFLRDAAVQTTIASSARAARRSHGRLQERFRRTRGARAAATRAPPSRGGDTGAAEVGRRHGSPERRRKRQRRRRRKRQRRRRRKRRRRRRRKRQRRCRRRWQGWLRSPAAAEEETTASGGAGG